MFYVKFVELDEHNNNPAQSIYNIYLFDVVMNSGQNFSNVKSIINYTAEPNLNIDHQLIQDLKNKLIDVIFIYSKRAADQLLKIILKHKIMNDLDNCSLKCISINVANTLKRLKWKKIKIFSPGEEELSLL